MGLIVKDLLQRNNFESASILAGSNGLNRHVSWAHIIEIEHFGHLLHGEEVILTTGNGWAHDESRCLAHLQQLIDNNASALCVELVVNAKKLPEKMLDLAEQHNLPIIAFTKEVRFIDITKDLHELILGHHENTWLALEQLHQRLLNSLTTDGTLGDFLHILHSETKKHVMLTYANQYRFFPTPSIQKQEYWKNQDINTGYVSQPISLLHQQFGVLTFLNAQESINKFDELALKRCSEIISQFFWRHHQQKEIKQLERNTWILDMMKSKASHEVICDIIHQHAPGIRLYDAIIGLKSFEKSMINNDNQYNNETGVLMAFRSLLQKDGFELLSVKDDSNGQYILFIINQQKQPLLPRLKRVYIELQREHTAYTSDNPITLFGFGRVFDDYQELSQGYQTASTVLIHQRKTSALKEPFHYYLGINRIIHQFHNQHELKAIITDYLEPIIQYDYKKGTELTKTLQVYLSTLGQKNTTAKELHIVRQTLYHRLQKIEELLGADYMLPENRFMIEFALHLLHSKYIY